MMAPDRCETCAAWVALALTPPRPPARPEFAPAKIRLGLCSTIGGVTSRYGRCEKWTALTVDA